MNCKIRFEYAEAFKMTGDQDKAFEITLEAFKIAFRADDLARCYRNLGFYFVEKELYREAVACYRMSLVYEPEAKQVQSELYYISAKTGEKIYDPSRKELDRYADKYGFPIGADEDVVGLSYAHGQHCYEQEQYGWAGYFWGITYELTDDEDIRKKLDEIQQRMN